MKSSYKATILLALLSLLTGFLLSSISFAGKTGINLMYTEYKFLRTWWKAGLLVFVVLMLFYLLQLYVSQHASKTISNLVNVAALLIAIGGLCFSYFDFQNTISHRLLGQRFHIGVYLFWIGWIVITIMQLLKTKWDKSLTNLID